jgi:hypothetical protein
VFFGQFFNHGLNLVQKTRTEIVFMPLQPDDPLIMRGPDATAGTQPKVDVFLTQGQGNDTTIDASIVASSRTWHELPAAKESGSDIIAGPWH